MDSTWDRIREEQGEVWEALKWDPNPKIQDPALTFRFNTYCKGSTVGME